MACEDQIAPGGAVRRNAGDADVGSPLPAGLAWGPGLRGASRRGRRGAEACSQCPRGGADSARTREVSAALPSRRSGHRRRQALGRQLEREGRVWV